MNFLDARLRCATFLVGKLKHAKQQLSLSEEVRLVGRAAGQLHLICKRLNTVVHLLYHVFEQQVRKTNV